MVRSQTNKEAGERPAKDFLVENRPIFKGEQERLTFNSI